MWLDRVLTGTLSFSFWIFSFAYMQAKFSNLQRANKSSKKTYKQSDESSKLRRSVETSVRNTVDSGKASLISDFCLSKGDKDRKPSEKHRTNGHLTETDYTEFEFLLAQFSVWREIRREPFRSVPVFSFTDTIINNALWLKFQNMVTELFRFPARTYSISLMWTFNARFVLLSFF